MSRLGIWIFCVCTLATSTVMEHSSYDVIGTDVVQKIVDGWQKPFITYSNTRIYEFLDRVMQLGHARNVPALREYLDTIGASGIGVGSLMYAEDTSGYITLTFIDLVVFVDGWYFPHQAKAALESSLKRFYDQISRAAPSSSNWAGVTATFDLGSQFGAVSPCVIFQTRILSPFVVESFFVHIRHK